jgi:nitrous oxidase accessory protein NosD
MRTSSLPRRLVLWTIAIGALICIGTAAWGITLVSRTGVPPRLLGPYLQWRSSGHNPLIEKTGELTADVLAWLDRGSVKARQQWPAWVAPLTSAAVRGGTREVLVVDVGQLRTALTRALPGDVITIAPGRYRVEGAALAVERPGRVDAPITVRAPRVGLATLEFNLVEGFHVLAPHWVFENLVIEGACPQHDDCEHAFHVVGAASATVIRNNELRDFNAHIKINGERGRYPDGGLVADNRIYNTTARRTENPVTPIDLVAASDWTIRGNLVADFVKDGSDRTSYGAFAKGGGSGNLLEGNTVLCEHRLRGAPGRRVGLSFGGGGSGQASCRAGRCTPEHDLGMMRDNLIASCSDAGVYLNRATNSRLEHNTLLDTAGVQTRSAGELLFMANLVDGPLRIDAESFLTARDSRTSALSALYLGVHTVRSLFADAAALDLRWAGAPPALSAPHAARSDLCGAVAGQRQVIGAFEEIGRCQRADAR